MAKRLVNKRSEGGQRFVAKCKGGMKWRQTVRTVRKPPQKLRKAKAPIGKPWPVSDLKVFDGPFEMGWGTLLRDVMRARGWRYSTKPCHAESQDDEEEITVHMREFEACLRGQTPEQAFGRANVTEDGYRLKAIPLPRHALWMLGRMPFRVPGTAAGRTCFRDDFVVAVVRHGAELKGDPGNHRICKFPGTEHACNKIELTKAFKNKPWYPTTYVLPHERKRFMQEVRAADGARSNYWIGKPGNDYGGKGICVWQGGDPDLRRVAHESTRQPQSVVQRYLHDPLLIGGYKFHMRIHLLITSLDPVQAYVQENGQCLFATKPYTLSGKTLGACFDAPVHVTNMGLNATPENKENYFLKKPVIGAGQQIRMRQLEAYLAKHYPFFDKRKLWEQILDIARDMACYIAQAPCVRRYGKLIPDRHFEIFGMDLMLDKKLKVWMCETNTDPGLEYPDKDVLGSPNPDYNKEAQACSETWHDVFALLGLDASHDQQHGSLRSWFELDCSA
eukprot:TRINITY_DN3009_c0_g1_i1.p1 TRINITY_DN3009_c0_g1~~TRINITY_DN3009_c0_g1_i1.p1  ORF type:complete len:537 (+),score=92.07 TRINITY_DN3009_c0_g1_i1:103-1611(+)